MSERVEHVGSPAGAEKGEASYSRGGGAAREKPVHDKPKMSQEGSAGRAC